MPTAKLPKTMKLDQGQHDQITYCLDHLVGATLDHVKKPQFDIGFIFLDKIYVRVDVGRGFQFRIDKSKAFTRFDPNADMSGDQKFPLGFFTFIGSEVTKATLTDETILIEFENSGQIKIDIEISPFEQLLFTGYTKKELVFLVPV